jgi:GAF domain-containing protein
MIRSPDELPLREARHELTELMQEEIPFKEARGALEVGKQYLNVENGHLTRIDQQTDHWEAIVSTDVQDGQFPEGLTLDLQTTYCRQTLTEESPITLHDAPNQSWAADPAFEEHGLHCYYGTTLRADEEPYGTVCFVSEDPRRELFSEPATPFIEYLTQSLERELEHEQYEAELTRQTNLSTSIWLEYHCQISSRILINQVSIVVDPPLTTGCKRQIYSPQMVPTRITLRSTRP